VQRVVTVLLMFAEKNPGMTRVLIGDALVNEDERLQVRINQLFDRLESTLKQSLRIAETQSGRKREPEAQANLILCYVIGRWQQFAKSGFKRKPMEFVQLQLPSLI
jgi:TetR/AcrR family transcriptional regulator